MTKRVLFAATIDIHIIKFHLPYLKYFKDLGYEVHVACNGTNEIDYTDIKHDIPFKRSPFKADNYKAYRKLKRIIDTNFFDIIHCHTPMGAVITRMAAQKSRKNGTKVIYTAHGFHFYKGAPLINWLLYYPIEKICSYFTDILITINKEDYLFAQKKFMKSEIYYVSGVGINTNKLEQTSVDRDEKRKKIQVPIDAIMVLSVGELNKNKNHQVILHALAKINNNKLHYCIAGKGALENDLKMLANSLGIGKNVHFLGYREDIYELYKIADIFAFPSFREGLPVSLMEAMVMGLPCVCSTIRGNVDLVSGDYADQLLINPINVNDFAKAIHILSKDVKLREDIGRVCKKNVEAFTLDIVMKDMKRIYLNSYL